ASVEQGEREGLWDGLPAFDPSGRLLQVLQGPTVVVAGDVAVRAGLEVQGPRPIRTRLQHVRHVVEFDVPGVAAPRVEQPVDEDATSPSVRQAVTQASRQLEPPGWWHHPATQRQLGEVERDGVPTLEVGAAVHEVET